MIRSNPPGEETGWKIELPSQGKRSQLPVVKRDTVWYPPADPFPGARWAPGEDRLKEIAPIEDTWFSWTFDEGQVPGTLNPRFAATVDLPDFTTTWGLPASIFFEISLYSTESDFNTTGAWAMEIDLSNALANAVLKPLETSFISPYVASFRGFVTGIMKNTPVPGIRVKFDTFWNAMPNPDRAVPMTSSWYINYTYPYSLGGITSDAPTRLVANPANDNPYNTRWEFVHAA